MIHDFGKRMDGPGGRRLAPREPVLLTASLLLMDASRGAILIDISATGAQLRTTHLLEEGQSVWLKLPIADLFGTVMWMEDSMAGLLFDEPLDEQELAMIRDKGRVTPCRHLSPDEQIALDDWNAGLAR